MTLVTPIAVAVQVARALDELEIPYLVGGSLASSTHGIPRATQDIDLVVRLTGNRVDALVARLEGDFFIDRDMALDAVMRRSSFNLLHLATMLKIDLFVFDRSEHATAEMQRARTIGVGEPPYPLRICSAEDIVLQKLDWFQKGGGGSERQWRDVVGVLSVQSQAIDVAYLAHWANVMQLSVLLDKALAEAGLV